MISKETTSKVFIVAELSANHNNDFQLAKDTIVSMKESGADAVKIQTYTADSLTLNVDNKYFGPRIEGLWKGRRPYELFQEAAMPYHWQPELKSFAEDLGLLFFSSPFDMEGVDFLESMDVPMYKIASMEITDIPLIEYVAAKGKPIIISTGVADIEDIQLAIDTCRSQGNNQITLLKCTSQYPSTIGQANLITIPDMKKRFGVDIGVSDHTQGFLVPTVAVSLGAVVVEKHFILDRKLGGPDSAFSMEPKEFKQMVESVRQAVVALGYTNYNITNKDKNRRRSLFVVNNIKAGEIITEKNVRSIRPGIGMHPKNYYSVLGKVAKLDIERGTPLSWDLIK